MGPIWGESDADKRAPWATERALEAPVELQAVHNDPEEKNRVGRGQNPESVRADIMADKRDMGIERCYGDRREYKRDEKNGQARRGKPETHVWRPNRL